MSAGDPIGRLLNLVHTADDVYVNLVDAGAATFIGQLNAGDTFTVTEAKTAAGGNAQVLPKVTKYNTAAKDGSGAWTTNSQAPGSTVVTADSSVVTITVRSEQLSDGYKYVKVTSTSTGTVMAVLHDLKTQRTPANLALVTT